MAIQGFCPPSPPSPPSHSPPSHSHSPYYQLRERGSARLGRVKNLHYIIAKALEMGIQLHTLFMITFLKS